MWDVIVVLTFNSIRCPHPPLAIIMFLSCYLLGTFILVSEYMSCFTSLMVSKSYITPPIDNVEQLWASKMLWLGGRMTDYYFDHFQNITDIEDRLLGLRWKNENEEAKIAIQKLLLRPDDYVYFERKGLIQWNICHHDIKLNGRRLYYSKETIGTYSTYLYLTVTNSGGSGGHQFLNLNLLPANASPGSTSHINNFIKISFPLFIHRHYHHRLFLCLS